MSQFPATRHIPILAKPIIEALIEPFRQLPDDGVAHWIVDCTLGGGGHAAMLLDALKNIPGKTQHKLLSVDQDPEAVERGRQYFSKEIAAGRMEILHSRFGEIAPALEGRRVLGLMADLGFSSDQIEDPARGLAFSTSGPLDMRLDPTRGESAYELLGHLGENELSELIQEYAEERYARRIASAICRARTQSKLPTTSDGLADLIRGAVPAPYRHGRLHPATRTFQALRIAVNQELEELDSLLERVILCVQPGGRVAILSFHSLEDRKVKRVFKPKEHLPSLGSVFRQLTKKPIEPDAVETRSNPRSRSAKLRIA